MRGIFWIHSRLAKIFTPKKTMTWSVAKRINASQQRRIQPRWFKLDAAREFRLACRCAEVDQGRNRREGYPSGVLDEPQLAARKGQWCVRCPRTAPRKCQLEGFSKRAPRSRIRSFQVYQRGGCTGSFPVETSRRTWFTNRLIMTALDLPEPSAAFMSVVFSRRKTDAKCRTRLWSLSNIPQTQLSRGNPLSATAITVWASGCSQ